FGGHVWRHPRLYQTGKQFGLNDVKIACLPPDQKVMQEMFKQAFRVAGSVTDKLPADTQPPDADTYPIDVVNPQLMRGLHPVHTCQKGAVANDLTHAVIGTLQISGADVCIDRQHDLAGSYRCRQSLYMLGAQGRRLGGLVIV